VTSRAAAIVDAAVNFVLGLIFIHSGAAGWLWERVERDVSWRTGPTAIGALTYFAIYWGAWMLGNVAVQVICQPEARRRILHPTACTGIAARGVMALIASCVIVAVQVLATPLWLPVVLASLLFAMLMDSYITREPLPRTVIAWAWSGAGLALATLLIHPWFVGQPLFVVRLAVVMTLWDFLGERLGISRRIARLVPSLYCGSRLTADQARVAT
jgi:hypothetical protein